MAKYVDTGVDYNDDNHCDIEGYFLSREKSHKAILRDESKKSSELEKEAKKEFKINYDSECFSFPSLDELNSCTPYLERYSSNSKEDLFSSPRINKLLRNNFARVDIDTNNAIWYLDRATKMFKTKNDMYVFRGIGGDLYSNGYLLNLARLEIGDKYSDKAFLSTSTSLFTACRFAEAGAHDLVVILKMKLPKGTECVPIVCNEKEESEILLGRDKRFKITNKNSGYAAGKIIVSLTMSLEK